VSRLGTAEGSPLYSISSSQIPVDRIQEAQHLVASKLQTFRDQYQLKEEQLSVTLEETSCDVGEVVAPESADSLLALLMVVPHGVAKMSHAVLGDASPHL